MFFCLMYKKQNVIGYYFAFVYCFFHNSRLDDLKLLGLLQKFKVVGMYILYCQSYTTWRQFGLEYSYNNEYNKKSCNITWGDQRIVSLR